jgi:hypothetical protein
MGFLFLALAWGRSLGFSFPDGPQRFAALHQRLVIQD